MPASGTITFALHVCVPTWAGQREVDRVPRGQERPRSPRPPQIWFLLLWPHTGGGRGKGRAGGAAPAALPVGVQAVREDCPRRRPALGRRWPPHPTHALQGRPGRKGFPFQVSLPQGHRLVHLGEGSSPFSGRPGAQQPSPSSPCSGGKRAQCFCILAPGPLGPDPSHTVWQRQHSECAGDWHSRPLASSPHLHIGAPAPLGLKWRKTQGLFKASQETPPFRGQLDDRIIEAHAERA